MLWDSYESMRKGLDKISGLVDDVKNCKNCTEETSQELQITIFGGVGRGLGTHWSKRDLELVLDKFGLFRGEVNEDKKRLYEIKEDILYRKDELTRWWCQEVDDVASMEKELWELLDIVRDLEIDIKGFENVINIVEHQINFHKEK